MTDAYQYTKQDKRKTVKMKDLEAVLRDNELYDFLLTDSSIMLRNQGKDDSDGKRARLNEAGASAKTGDEQHDYWLPLSNIRRIARAHLESDEVTAPGAKVSLEGTVVAGVSRAATVFISVLTAAALDTCGKRTTLMNDNVHKGLQAMEFTSFQETLTAFQVRQALPPRFIGSRGRPR